MEDTTTEIDIAGMSEAALVYLTSGLLQECQARLVDTHEQRDTAPIAAMNDMLRAAFADPKAMTGQQLSDTLFATLKEVGARYRAGEEGLKPALQKLAEIFARKGRLTVEVKPVPIILDVSTNTVIEDTAQIRKAAPHVLEQAEKVRSYRHLDLEDLYDGQVLVQEIPYVTVLERQVRTDPTKVEMPAGWTSELGKQIADGMVAGLSKVPAPIVEVENIVETPAVHIHEAPQEPVQIDFNRDRAGRISGATTKPVE